MTAPNDQQPWQVARLIPVTGIGGVAEQERRATSALLAVLSAVDEFGRTVLSSAGAPAGRIETFIETRFELGEATVIPDGLVTVSRGKRTWTALVEVKTGDNKLVTQQLENYLDVARAERYDAVITISNEISTVANSHPTDVNKRKLRKVELVHFSWTRILTMAIVVRSHRGVADPDQAWILGELIRYLENPQAGALARVDMGPSWVAVRDAAQNGSLRGTDRGVPEIVNQWDQLLRYAGLMLSRELGAAVEPVLPTTQRNDPKARTDALVAELVATGRLEGRLAIPDVIAPITIFADLRTRHVGARVEVAAPKEGRARTRATWLLRQLKHAPANLIVDAYVARGRDSMSEPLSAAVANPELLLDPAKRDPTRFALTLLAPMGSKRGEGNNGFPTSVLDVLTRFYETTAQTMKAWTPSAPKLKRESEPTELPGQATTAIAIRHTVEVDPLGGVSPSAQ